MAMSVRGREVKGGKLRMREKKVNGSEKNVIQFYLCYWIWFMLIPINILK